MTGRELAHRGPTIRSQVGSEVFVPAHSSHLQPHQTSRSPSHLFNGSTVRAPFTTAPSPPAPRRPRRTGWCCSGCYVQNDPRPVRQRVQRPPGKLWKTLNFSQADNASDAMGAAHELVFWRSPSTGGGGLRVETGSCGGGGREGAQIVFFCFLFSEKTHAYRRVLAPRARASEQGAPCRPRRQ